MYLDSYQYKTPRRTTCRVTDSPYTVEPASSHRSYGLSSPRYANSPSSPSFSAPTTLCVTPVKRSVTPVRLSVALSDDSPRSYRPSSYSSNAPLVSAFPSPSSITRNYLSSPQPMVTDACTTFIPPQRAEDRGKPVVVLDLDETLIYARDGPVIARPGLSHLFRVLHGRCEVVIWTAGEREYALDAIRQIDALRCVQHCIYRHRKWWTGQPGYTKNLCALGRPLERSLLVENTPDCTKDNPLNSLLVKDFSGDDRRRDDTLYHLTDILEAVLASGPHRHISDVLYAHPTVALREVRCDSVGSVRVFTLAHDEHPADYYSAQRNLDLSPRRASSSRRYS